GMWATIRYWKLSTGYCPTCPPRSSKRCRNIAAWRASSAHWRASDSRSSQGASGKSLRLAAEHSRPSASSCIGRWRNWLRRGGWRSGKLAHPAQRAATVKRASRAGPSANSVGSSAGLVSLVIARRAGLGGSIEDGLVQPDDLGDFGRREAG